MPVRILPDLLKEDDFPVTFGRYQLLGILGEGGMARVFRAELQGPSGFRKKTALKVIRASVAAHNEKIRQALINEARLGGLLKHPNIVDTYEFGDVDGQLYIAMELVDGIALDALIEKERDPDNSTCLPPQQALAVAAQMCSGLDHAHNIEDNDEPARLVHRDLKPSNVIITRQGLVKLMDFGIAKAASLTTSMTDPGMTKGTPAYMSPEQAAARPLDQRSDLFTMGSILYELVTGRPFFGADTVVALLLAVVHVEEALTEDVFGPVDAQVPGLGSVIRKCMRKDRRLRYDSAWQLEAEIKRLQQQLPLGAPLRTYIQSLSYEIIVSASGTGHVKTINAALRKARAGTRITVRPGRYKETLRIDKAVEIVGDGPRKQIIVGCLDDDCIALEAPKATVRGLTLRARPGKKGIGGAVVRVSQGSLLLEDCDIKSYAQAGVIVEGAAASPTIRRCRIHDCAGPGLAIRKSAQATVEQCDFSSNHGPGLFVGGGANPVVRRCRMHQGRTIGLTIDGGSKGIFEDCDIASNGVHGVRISGNSQPSLRRCLVHHSRSVGVLVEDHAEVGIELCDIFGNARAGVLAQGSARINGRECQVHDNRGSGGVAIDSSNMQFEDCEIFGNRFAGVEGRGGASVSLLRTRLRGAGDAGSLASDRAEVSLTGCELDANSRAGALADSGGVVRLVECQVRDTVQGPGVLLELGGHGELVDCLVAGSGHAGVQVISEGDVSLHGCRVVEGRQSGVHLGHDARARLSNCTLGNNGRAGLLVSSGGMPELMSCEVVGNHGFGVQVLDGGTGRLEACEVKDNRRGDWSLAEGAQVQRG